MFSVLVDFSLVIVFVCWLGVVLLVISVAVVGGIVVQNRFISVCVLISVSIDIYNVGGDCNVLLIKIVINMQIVVQVVSVINSICFWLIWLLSMFQCCVDSIYSIFVVVMERLVCYLVRLSRCIIGLIIVMKDIIVIVLMSVVNISVGSLEIVECVCMRIIVNQNGWCVWICLCVLIDWFY